MANFYTEVPELKYHLNNSMMERICELKERGYQDKDKYDYAPQDYADAMDSFKKTLEFFGLDPEDEGNQKRLRNLENGQCLMQDLYGHVGVVQFHPVFADLLHGFDTRPPLKAEVVA